MEAVNSPQLDAKLQELQGAVSQYSQYDTQNTQKKSAGWNFDFNPNYVYVAIPVVLFVLLLIMRPSFVKAETKMDDGTVKTQTSFQKIVVWTLVIGGLLDVGLYGANYKLKRF